MSLFTENYFVFRDPEPGADRMPLRPGGDVDAREVKRVAREELSELSDQAEGRAKELAEAKIPEYQKRWQKLQDRLKRFGSDIPQAGVERRLKEWSDYASRQIDYYSDVAEGYADYGLEQVDKGLQRIDNTLTEIENYFDEEFKGYDELEKMSDDERIAYYDSLSIRELTTVFEFDDGYIDDYMINNASDDMFEEVLFYNFSYYDVNWRALPDNSVEEANEANFLLLSEYLDNPENNGGISRKMLVDALRRIEYSVDAYMQEDPT